MRDVQPNGIRASDAGNIMDLPEEIQPGWPHFHGLTDPADPSERQGPLVMCDDVPPHPLFTLEYIPHRDVREIQHLNRTYAQNQYPVIDPDGVILVLTSSLVVPEPETPPDTGRTSQRREEVEADERQDE